MQIEWIGFKDVQLKFIWLMFIDC